MPEKIKYVSMPKHRVAEPYRGSRIYHRAHWRKLRLVKLAHNPACEADGCNAVATEVDHIDGNNRNMRMSNLQSLCKSCHSKKTYRKDGGLGNERSI
jgi:5-methylcytosine-specific restriction endonuclease McrA